MEYACLLYTSCLECAKLIIQSRIRRVVYGEQYRLTDGVELLERAGIEVVYIPLDEMPSTAHPSTL